MPIYYVYVVYVCILRVHIRTEERQRCNSQIVETQLHSSKNNVIRSIIARVAWENIQFVHANTVRIHDGMVTMSFFSFLVSFSGACIQAERGRWRKYLARGKHCERERRRGARGPRRRPIVGDTRSLVIRHVERTRETPSRSYPTCTHVQSSMRCHKRPRKLTCSRLEGAKARRTG